METATEAKPRGTIKSTGIAADAKLTPEVIAYRKQLAAGIAHRENGKEIERLLDSEDEYLFGREFVTACQAPDAGDEAASDPGYREPGDEMTVADSGYAAMSLTRKLDSLFESGRISRQERDRFGATRLSLADEGLRTFLHQAEQRRAATFDDSEKEAKAAFDRIFHRK